MISCTKHLALRLANPHAFQPPLSYRNIIVLSIGRVSLYLWILYVSFMYICIYVCPTKTFGTVGDRFFCECHGANSSTGRYGTMYNSMITCLTRLGSRINAYGPLLASICLFCPWWFGPISEILVSASCLALVGVGDSSTLPAE